MAESKDENSEMPKDGKSEVPKLRSDFMWGTATASYQIEGAWNEGGKSPNIWDTLTHAKGNVINRDTGDVACDHYHHMPEDVELMSQLGTNSYRFSLSWCRIIPGGVKGSPVNPEGVAFYDKLINLLLEKNIKPLVTLYHWDLPQSVQDDNLGFLNPDFHEHFTYYAEVCFEKFSDRVKDWITFNEPWCTCVMGHAMGLHAPGRLENTGVEPYIAAHNLLIAHSNAYHMFHEKYNAEKDGKLAITLNSEWFQSIDGDDPENSADISPMAQAGLDWNLGWFASPIWGNEDGEHDYPKLMKAMFAERDGLKERVAFTDAQRAKLANSSDFFALNHYTTQFCTERGSLKHAAKTAVHLLGMFWNSMPTLRRGIKIVRAVAGENFMSDVPVKHVVAPELSAGATDMGLEVVPFGFRKLLQYIHRRYNPPGGIVVTENGCAYAGDVGGSGDRQRIRFGELYLAEMKKAVESGVDLRGYFFWSFMDNFEWSFGYGKRFGLVKVDYEREDRKRTPRKVFEWYKGIVSGETWDALKTS